MACCPRCCPRRLPAAATSSRRVYGSLGRVSCLGSCRLPTPRPTDLCRVAGLTCRRCARSARPPRTSSASSSRRRCSARSTSCRQADSVVPSWSQRSIRCPSVSHSTSMVIPALSSAGAGRRHSEPTSCGTAVQEAGACGEPERLALLNAARPGSARSYAASSRVSIGRTDDFRLGHGAGLLPPRRCRKSVERAGHLEESAKRPRSGRPWRKS